MSRSAHGSLRYFLVLAYVTSRFLPHTLGSSTAPASGVEPETASGFLKKQATAVVRVEALSGLGRSAGGVPRHRGRVVAIAIG